MHQIARRWVAAGAHVTWFTARAAGQERAEVLDGIRFLRSGGELSLYLHAAARMVRAGSDVDVVVDCQNGIPFFSPLFAGRACRSCRWSTTCTRTSSTLRFPRPVAALGRFLEGPATRGSTAPRRSWRSRRPPGGAAHRLRFRGPIHLVPNGTSTCPT